MPSKIPRGTTRGSRRRADTYLAESPIYVLASSTIALTFDTQTRTLSGDIASGFVPPIGSSFITSTTEASLTGSRALTAGTGISITLGSGTATVAVSDPELLALAGLTSASNKLPYFTGSGTAALADLTTAGRALIDDADATTQRTTLGLGTLATQSGTFSGTHSGSSSGTNTGDQTSVSGNAGTVTTNANLTGPVTSVGNATTIADAELAAIAALTSASNKLPYFTGAGTAALADLTAAGRALIDDANATAQRTTLGLGSAAITDATDYEVPLTFSTGLTRTTNTITISSTVATLTGSETLTNKTLTTPTIGSFTNATHTHQNAAGGGTLSHASALTGLSNDDHTQYALLAGRSGGQTIKGGTASGNSLTLLSTNHATKGKVVLGTASAYDEVNDRLGIGTTIPSGPFHLRTDWGGALSTQIMFFADSYADRSRFVIRRANGTVASPTQVVSADTVGQFAFRGWHSGGDWGASSLAGFEALATENFTSSGQGCDLGIFACPVGSTAGNTQIYVRGSGEVEFTASAYQQFVERTTTPTNPTAGAEVNLYMKSDKLVLQYNDGGTVRYKYLDLTGTGVTWVHTTVAP